MWDKIISFKDLVSEGRWKVEFFSGVLNVSHQSKYPFAKVNEIVCENRKTIDPQNEPNKLYNYLGLENIESLTGDLVNFKPKRGTEIKSRTKVFSKGNVLYGRLRTYLNKVYLADGEISEGICSGEFFVLIPNQKKVLPRILRYLLASPFVAGQVAKFQSGAALPRVPINDFMNLAIPLPPIDKQKILEQLLIKADTHRLELRRQLDALPQKTMETFMKNLQQN